MFIPSLYDPYIHSGKNKWKFGDPFSYFNRHVLIPPPGFKKNLTINLTFSDLKITSPIYSPRQFISNYSPSYSSSSSNSVIVDIEPEPSVIVDIEPEPSVIVDIEPEPSVIVDIEHEPSVIVDIEHASNFEQIKSARSEATFVNLKKKKFKYYKKKG